MTDENTDSVRKHERIRFRREEIVDLSVLPSSRGIAPPTAPRNRRPAWSLPVRIATWVAGLAAVCFLILLGGLSYISHSGIGARQLQAQAERALEQLVGSEMDIAIADAHFAFSGPGLLNLELTDVSLGPHGAPEPILKTSGLRLGLDLMPLLMGRVSIKQAELATARLDAQAIPAGNGASFDQVFDSNGLVDPDLLLAAIFNGVDMIGQTVRSGGAPDLLLRDITLSFGAGLPLESLTISEATMVQSPDGVDLAGSLMLDRRPARFSAKLHKPQGSAEVEKFEIRLDSDRPEEMHKSFDFGDALISIAGDRSDVTRPRQVQIVFDANDISVDLGTRGRLGGQLALTTTLAAGSNKIEIDRLDSRLGQSSFKLEGAIGRRPADDRVSKPAYRFELVSTETQLAPVDTGEPAMPMAMRLDGYYRPDNKVVLFEQVLLATRRSDDRKSEAVGTGSVTLTESGPPGLALDLEVAEMNVSHVKQLWPWFAAEAARRWVNTNLKEGLVSAGRIKFAVVPGRLGNGQRLLGDEVSGEFSIQGARFDTTGSLPQISDAVGAVSFAGDDVEITLERGQASLRGGPVSVKDGQLVISDAGSPPVLGQLRMNISGPARAVAELADLEPINVMRFTGLEPGGVSGSVSGNVSATIPMQKGIDRKHLDWDVKLAFRDLALAKPMDGQTITGADGTLEVDRSSAVIKARTGLNGVPADVSMVLPLPGSGTRAQRDISMTLDRRALQRIAPGLNNIVDGPVRVRIDASDRQRQVVEADLGAAVLAIPDVGWTKGNGVPARVTFELQRRSDTLQLENFRLAGDSFGASGTLTIANGALASARLTNVRLNRGDNISLRIDRERGSYSIVVDGETLDGKAFIRNATSPQGKAARAVTGIALRGNVRKLVGFHEEALAGVSLNYVTGAGGSSLSLKGQAGGRAVSLENGKGSLAAQTQNAGALLRFLGIYQRVQGGTMSVRLQSGDEGGLVGSVDMRDFLVVNEPKLGSMVTASPQGADRDGRPRIDTSRVRFDHGFANIDRGRNHLRLKNGVLRGEAMGTTFQGTLYDANNRMDITGTFMPAYGINRIFGDVPVVGALLGNGNDKGLIGVTYRLAGNARQPNLQINPLSVIAPGIFRSIFEYR